MKRRGRGNFSKEFCKKENVLTISKKKFATNDFPCTISQSDGCKQNGDDKIMHRFSQNSKSNNVAKTVNNKPSQTDFAKRNIATVDYITKEKVQMIDRKRGLINLSHITKPNLKKAKVNISCCGKKEGLESTTLKDKNLTTHLNVIHKKSNMQKQIEDDKISGKLAASPAENKKENACITSFRHNQGQVKPIPHSALSSNENKGQEKSQDHDKRDSINGKDRDFLNIEKAQSCRKGLLGDNPELLENNDKRKKSYHSGYRHSNDDRQKLHSRNTNKQEWDHYRPPQNNHNNQTRTKSNLNSSDRVCHSNSRYKYDEMQTQIGIKRNKVERCRKRLQPFEEWEDRSRIDRERNEGAKREKDRVGTDRETVRSEERLKEWEIVERERSEKERKEREILKKERIEREIVQRERSEKELAKNERVHKERAENERVEKERAENERLEKEQAERKRKERIDAEAKEKARIEEETREKERAKIDKREKLSHIIEKLARQEGSFLKACELVSPTKTTFCCDIIFDEPIDDARKQNLSYWGLVNDINTTCSGRSKRRLPLNCSIPQFYSEWQREWYLQNLHGRYFEDKKPRINRVYVNNVRCPKIQSHLSFLQKRRMDEFAERLSKTFKLEGRFPRCEIPKTSWNILRSGDSSFIFMFYPNQYLAEKAVEKFNNTDNGEGTLLHFRLAPYQR